MIPEQFHICWNWYSTNYLKTLGSGGGGYILGFTEDLERAKLSLKDYKLVGGVQF
jgi:mevalonate kinase